MLMKKCKSIVLITALILSLAAVSCGQSAKGAPTESAPEAAEDAGSIGETAPAAAEDGGSIEESGTEAVSPDGGIEESGANAVTPDGNLVEAGTGEVFPAGNPEEVDAVILHTNDVHVGLQDNIGYDGLA